MTVRIGPASRSDHDLRITHWDGSGNLLTIELTWDDWDELIADADHLRATGSFRDVVV